MKQHQYKISNKKVKSNSFLLSLSIVIYFGGILVFEFIANHHFSIVFIFWTIFMLAFLIPSIRIFANYYRYSKKTRIEITYDKIFCYQNDILITELENKEISEIQIIEAPGPVNSLPWCFLSYFILIDNKNQKIIIPNYIMDLGDFWMDTLTRKVSSKNIVRIKNIFPLIPKS